MIYCCSQQPTHGFYCNLIRTPIMTCNNITLTMNLSHQHYLAIGIVDIAKTQHKGKNVYFYLLLVSGHMTSNICTLLANNHNKILHTHNNLDGLFFWTIQSKDLCLMLHSHHKETYISNCFSLAHNNIRTDFFVKLRCLQYW